MYLEVLKIGTLIGLFIVPLFFPVKKKKAGIRLPKNYNCTRGAHYMVNEYGRLEEITHDNLSNPFE